MTDRAAAIEAPDEFPPRAMMVSSARARAFDECAAICREIMEAENAYAQKNPNEDIQLHAPRWSRYGTAKQILERIAALPTAEPPAPAKGEPEERIELLEDLLFRFVQDWEDDHSLSNRAGQHLTYTTGILRRAKAALADARSQAAPPSPRRGPA